MTLELRTKDVMAALTAADERGESEGSDLFATYEQWVDRLVWLLDSSTPLTYLPVLTVCLVARSLDPRVDVRRIQAGDEYSASLVGRAVVDYGREHSIDMRTDSTNVMNSQPFVRQPVITPTLSPTPAYAAFYDLVEQVQAMTSDEALDVLALTLLQGRANWPRRQRRVQRNQVHAAPQLPIAFLPDEGDPRYIIATSSPAISGPDEYLEFQDVGSSTRDLIAADGGQFLIFEREDGERPGRFVGIGGMADVEEQPSGSNSRSHWRGRVSEFETFLSPVSETKAGLPGWNRQRQVSRIAADDFERIVRLGREGERTTTQPLTVDMLQAACTSERLAMPDHVLAALVAALSSGKHVILTGPPGTAKTTLAVVVARLAALNGLCDGYTLTTATADWSTYDTIGGLTPKADGTLSFRFGSFLQAIRDNRWLLVDELNRSNFDRAFGQLFTVLSNQDVVLQHTVDQSARDDHAAAAGLSAPRLIRIRREAQAEDERFHDVVLRRDWRMIGTINNFDKSLLFEMSFALMRRFAFVEVPAPSDDVYVDLVRDVLAEDAEDVARPTLEVVRGLLPLRGIKEIGPAVYLDAARMARSMFAVSALSSAEVALRVFYALLLPQFEGIDEMHGRRLLSSLRRVAPGQEDEVRRVLREVLGLDLGRRSETVGDNHGPSDLDLGDDLEIEIAGSFDGSAERADARIDDDREGTYR